MAAEALLQQAADEVPAGAETSNKKRKVLPSVLEDDRFKAMFQDPSFAVDEAADEYKFHHPNAGAPRPTPHPSPRMFSVLCTGWSSCLVVNTPSIDVVV